MTTSRLYCPPQEFTFRLRQRMPMNVGFTFTEDQLEALRDAFGDRFDRRHAVDVRGRLHLPWSRYYLVFQIGKDRRTDARKELVSRKARTVLDSAICGLCIGGIGSALLLAARHFLH
jgi:hypothetical protein